eukprot:TRINITY_DN10026_c0_g1_i13.p1 TRINITY_DN10026_c0_g1~~TRINITY_DN10026_c0_g1_i13.p1  ORF type:complete len:152 (+),score=26.78 TRINITY_DN10026_c0_g1_i13:202-657(+)
MRKIWLLLLVTYLALVPLAKRPSNVSPELYCEICLVILEEALSVLKHRKAEMDVFDALDNICDVDRLYKYGYSIMDARDACQAFVANWEEVLEKNLMNRTNSDQLAKTVCIEITRVCLRDNSTDTNADRVKKFKEKYMNDDKKRNSTSGDL